MRRFSHEDVSSSSQIKSSVQRGIRAKLIEQFPPCEVRALSFFFRFLSFVVVVVIFCVDFFCAIIVLMLFVLCLILTLFLSLVLVYFIFDLVHILICRNWCCCSCPRFGIPDCMLVRVGLMLWVVFERFPRRKMYCLRLAMVIEATMTVEQLFHITFYYRDYHRR